MTAAERLAGQCLAASRRAARRGDRDEAERWVKLAAQHVRLAERLWALATDKRDAARGWRMHVRRMQRN
jgi:hypothetical protein